MRALIQRVAEASVAINNEVHNKIENGLLIFVGIEDKDTEDDIEWISKKVVNLRIFDDENHVMNKSVIEINGEILVISQFTLHAMTKKGNRPSYIKASKPEIAIPVYESLCQEISIQLGKEIKTGIFGANMKVKLINDGPVTIWIDSKQKE